MNPYAEIVHLQRPRDGAADPLAETLSRAAFRAVEAIEAIEETVVTFIERLREGHRRRVTIRELSALDDYTLRDIGLHRSQISSVAHDLAAGGVAGGAKGRTASDPVVAKAAAHPANDNSAPPSRAAVCAG